MASTFSQAMLKVITGNAGRKDDDEEKRRRQESSSSASGSSSRLGSFVTGTPYTGPSGMVNATGTGAQTIQTPVLNAARGNSGPSRHSATGYTESALRQYGSGGNVDLLNRPVISGKELAAAGWDANPDDRATVFSSTYNNEAGTEAANFTPIVVDDNGKYVKTLSEKELQKYGEDVVAGRRQDDLHLQIGSRFTGKDAIQQADSAAERIHQLQDRYYPEGSEIEERFKAAQSAYQSANAALQAEAMSGMASAETAAKAEKARQEFAPIKEEYDNWLKTKTPEGRATQEHKQAMAELQMAAQSGGATAEQAGKEREAEDIQRRLGVAEDQRLRNFWSGSSKDIVGSLASAAATAAEAPAIEESARVAYDPMYREMVGNDQEKYRQEYRQESHEELKPLYDAADKLGDTAARDIEQAKKGLGTLGQAGVDIAKNMLEMGWDAAINVITNGGGLASMFLRTLGSAEQEARRNGATLEQQLGYGLTKASIEVATERVSGLANKWAYGKGLVPEDFAEKFISKLAQTDTGRTAFRMLFGGAGEVGEEVLSDILSPIAESMFMPDENGNLVPIGDLYSKEFSSDAMAEKAYNYAIAFAVALLSNAGNIVSGEDARANQALRLQELADAMSGEQQAAPSQLNTPEGTQELSGSEALARTLGGQTEAQSEAQPVSPVEQTTPVSRKQMQADIIEQSNPMHDDIHTGIRSADDILTFQEALAEDGIEAGDAGMTPDVTAGMIQRALETGQITVYSSYPIEIGNFVTPSKMEAQNYAGEGKVYSQTVNLDDVAWLDSNQGQYAPVQMETETPAAPVEQEQAQQEQAQAEVTAIEGQQEADADLQAAETNRHIQTVDRGAEPGTEGTKLSQSPETVQGAEATPEEFKALIGQNVEKGGYRYIPITNDESVQRATKYIQDEGWSTSLANWSRDVRQGRTGDQMSAVGALLYNNAVNSGDTKLAAQILSDYVIMGRNTARGLQAMSIIKNLSPDAKLYMVENAMRRLSESLSKRLPDGIKISEEAKQAYLDAKTDAERDKALGVIQKEAASQIPATFKDKWTALRYMNMLGNLRTQGRNLIGNTLMAGTTSLKNFNLRMLEGMASAITGGKYRRTVSLQVDSDLTNACMDYFKKHADFISGESKYSDVTSSADAITQGIMNQRRIFSFAPIEAYRKATARATEAGDRIFIGPRFARTMAGYLQANGIDAQTYIGIQNGSIQATAEQQSLINDAVNFAMREAQEATFHDSNLISDWISKAGRGKNTPSAIRALSEGLMPFRKTPANVAMRMYEYSPLGLIDTAVKAAQTKNGTATSSQVMNSLAKSLTGTGIFLLGMLGRAAGRLRGNEKDEKQENFDKLRGEQDYSFILPDGTSFTLDWASPNAATLFMGAQLYDLIQEGGFQLEDLGEIVARLGDPLISMSMLQGVNDALDNLRNTDNSLGQVAIDMGLNYLMQGLSNSFVGQLERISEDKRYTTFRDSNTNFGRRMQSTLGKLSAKTPVWDYNQAEYVDAWGRTQSTGSTFERAVSNLASPGYLSHDNSTAVDDELQRLYDSGYGNVFPQYTSMSEKISTYDEHGNKTGERKMTKDEWVEYQKVKGQTSLQLVSGLMESPAYESMSDDAKADAIAAIYKYAGNKADMAVEPSNKDEYAEVSKLSDIPAYFAAKAAFNDATNNRYDRNYEEAEAVLDGMAKLPKDVQEYLLSKDKELKKLLPAYKAGVSAETWYKSTDAAKDLTPYPGKKETTDAQEWQAMAGAVSDKQADIILKGYMEDGTYDRYMAARKEGVTAKQWTHAMAEASKLIPPEGKEDVAKWQQYEAIAKAEPGAADAILKGYLTENQVPQYEAVRKAGVTAQQWASANAGVAQLQPLQGEKSVKEWQQYEYIVQNHPKEAEALIPYFMNQDGPRERFKTATAVGVSPELYVAYYKQTNLITGKGKKDKLKQWVIDQGYSQKTASYMYDLFNANIKDLPGLNSKYGK